MYLGKGNKKLSKTILVWNIPAIKTCPNCSKCKDTCYARKAERLYPQVLPCRESNLEDTKHPLFVNNMIVKICEMQVNAKKHIPKHIRIHESGDFYSLKYFLDWLEIAKRLPDFKFWTYTKNLEVMDWVKKHNLPSNFNIVFSILPNGELNYGSHETVNKLSKKYRAAICPAKRSKKQVVCGENCKACEKRQYVVFDKH